jgi:hypothetical protein
MILLQLFLFWKIIKFFTFEFIKRPICIKPIIPAIFWAWLFFMHFLANTSDGRCQLGKTEKAWEKSFFRVKNRAGHWTAPPSRRGG